MGKERSGGHSGRVTSFVEMMGVSVLALSFTNSVLVVGVAVSELLEMEGLDVEVLDEEESAVIAKVTLYSHHLFIRVTF